MGEVGKQGEVTEQVAVRGSLSSNHRDHLLELALSDGGMMRLAHATKQVELASGRLVPVLLHWEVMDPPPLAIYYRPEQRRTLRLRIFADFVAACCAELSLLTSAKGAVQRRPPAGLAPRPQPSRVDLADPSLSTSHQSILAPVSRTYCIYCASASKISSRVSAGERAAPTISRRSIYCLKSAVWAAWRTAAARRSTISAGRRGGPSTKCAVISGAAATPDSASVGTAGSAPEPPFRQPVRVSDRFC